MDNNDPPTDENEATDVEKVYNQRYELAEELEDRLTDFAERHPVFADRFDVVAAHSSIEAHEWRDVTRKPDERRLESEWDFAVAYGYKEGIFEVLMGLERIVNSDYFEDGDDE